jgi:hypothetical protein
VGHKEKALHHLKEVERWDARVSELEAWAEKEIGPRPQTTELFLYRMKQQLNKIQNEYAQATGNRNHQMQMAIMYGIFALNEEADGEASWS